MDSLGSSTFTFTSRLQIRISVDGRLARAARRQRSAIPGRCRRRHAASLGSPRPPRSDGNEVRLRCWTVWSVHGSPGRRSCLITAAALLLAAVPQPSYRRIDSGITNLCRCGSHPRIRRAICRAVREGAKDSAHDRAGRRALRILVIGGAGVESPKTGLSTGR